MQILKNILLASILIVIVSACTSENRKKYAIGTEEALELYISKKDVLTAEKIANILLCDQENPYQFIDLRTPHEYIQSHVEGAINIPAKDILDMEYYDILNQSEKINVLYCRGQNQAINIYLILKQIGFKNIKVAMGGYDYINDYVVVQYGIKTGDYSGEKPNYDFLRLVAGISVPKSDSIVAPKNLYKNMHKVIKDFDEECPDLN
ncbi:MAG: hypothetical protein GQ527_11760 [Bacteroidales bacterium]|nr:hypothetical protein [Bacteroidales bacterium]